MALCNFYSFLLIFTLLLPGCNLATSLSTVGEPPQMTQIKDPRDVPGYEPVHMPMPDPVTASSGTNSLWQTGSRAFFKDQRAGKVGDVLSVSVIIDRKQSMKMNPNIERKSSLNTTVTEVLGHALPIQKRLAKTLPGKRTSDTGRLTDWVDMESNPSQKSTATYDVQDQMQFTMAAVIVQILPNGCLMD